jgi:hypothetical protein
MAFRRIVCLKASPAKTIESGGFESPPARSRAHNSINQAENSSVGVASRRPVERALKGLLDDLWRAFCHPAAKGNEGDRGNEKEPEHRIGNHVFLHGRPHLSSKAGVARKSSVIWCRITAAQ